MGGAADEPVDVVDEHDRVVDTVPRSEIRARRLRHRAVYIAVVTSSGALVVHRRADWKDVYPGYWDVAFGGVLGAGEGWDDAARRELAEEAGIEAPLRELGRRQWADDDNPVVGRIYRADHDGPFTFADGEVTDVATVPLGELGAWLAGRHVCPDSVALVLPLLT
jgi:8-oxo-dGTP pyrophosphatase MutT (NUDIX family)